MASSLLAHNLHLKGWSKLKKQLRIPTYDTEMNCSGTEAVFLQQSKLAAKEVSRIKKSDLQNQIKFWYTSGDFSGKKKKDQN